MSSKNKKTCIRNESTDHHQYYVTIELFFNKIFDEGILMGRDKIDKAIGNWVFTANSKEGATEEATANLVHKSIKYFIACHVIRLSNNYKGKTISKRLNLYNDLWEKYKLASKRFELCATRLDDAIDIFNKQKSSESLLKLDKLLVSIWIEYFDNNIQKQLINEIIQIIDLSRSNVQENMHKISAYIEHMKYLDSVMSPVIKVVEKDKYNEGETEEEKKPEKPKDPRESVFYNFFVSPFLESTRDYYKRHASNLFSTLPLSEYIKEVRNIIVHETIFSNRYLESYTRAEYINILIETLVQDRIEEICSVFDEGYRNKNYALISSIYFILVESINCRDQFNEIFRRCIMADAHEYMKNSKEQIDDKDYYQFLYALYEPYNNGIECIEKCMDGDKSSKSVLDIACDVFVNENIVIPSSDGTSTKSAELLARCSDYIFKNKKKLSDVEVDREIKKLVKMVQFLRNIEAFITFFSRLMIQRIISGKNFSNHYENDFITSMKTIFGIEVTKNFELLRRDEMISADITEKFRKMIENGVKGAPKTSVSYNFKVLTYIKAPIKQTFTFTLPPELRDDLSLFEAFYTGAGDKNQRCKTIQWLNQHCTGEVKLKQEKKSHIFVSNAMQITLLLKYNEGDSFTVDEITNYLDLVFPTLPMNTNNREEIKKRDTGVVVDQIIKTLVIPKILIRTKVDGKGGDIVSFNKNFKSARVRTDINKQINFVSKKFQENTNKDIRIAESTLVQSLIVKCMKSNKAMYHNDLVSKVLKDLKNFKANIALINKAIQTLIEKDYMSLDPEDKKRYLYEA